MAILLGQPVSDGGLNRGLCAWYYPIGAPYSGFTSWTDLVSRKQASVTASVTWNRAFSQNNAINYPAANFNFAEVATCPLPRGLSGAVKASASILLRNSFNATTVLPLSTGSGTDDYWPFSGQGYFGIFRTARVNSINPITGYTDWRDWTHLAFTTDGANWYAYQNGQQIGTAVAEATVTATELLIGKNGVGTFAGGSVGSVRVWVNRALSQADVMSDFIAATQGYRNQLNQTRKGFITTVAAGGGVNRRRRVLFCGRAA